MKPFTITHMRGPVADLHASEPQWIGREAWVMEVEAPGLVLGSTQRRDIVDDAAVASAGLEVVPRRSGGGAVLVDQHMLWVDLLIGRTDDLWNDDVGLAFGWVGDLWVDVLAACGVADVVVHQGALDAGQWGRTICFVSLGPGELRIGAQKVVGISQRRTREGARFQCSVLCAPGGDSQLMIPDLLELGSDERDGARTEVQQRVGSVPVTRKTVLAALEAHLGSGKWSRS